MPWWLWVLLGLVLLILEVPVTSGFYLMFFGIGALCVGLLTAVGFVAADWVQWLLFSTLSLLCVAFLRRPMMKKLNPAASTRVDTLVGETAIVLEDISSGGTGKAELRGSTWNAHNAAPTPLSKGSRCLVEHVKGLTLWIRPE